MFLLSFLQEIEVDSKVPYNTKINKNMDKKIAPNQQFI